MAAWLKKDITSRYTTILYNIAIDWQHSPDIAKGYTRIKTTTTKT